MTTLVEFIPLKHRIERLRNGKNTREPWFSINFYLNMRNIWRWRAKVFEIKWIDLFVFLFYYTIMRSFAGAASKRLNRWHLQARLWFSKKWHENVIKNAGKERKKNNETKANQTLTRGFTKPIGKWCESWVSSSKLWLILDCFCRVNLIVDNKLNGVFLHSI